LRAEPAVRAAKAAIVEQHGSRLQHGTAQRRSKTRSSKTPPPMQQQALDF